jgi:carboxypeptidase C (cathepsin A)
MLYIEAPVGVGFSYSSTGDYKCADDRTADENRAAVEYFYSQYPEYKNNKLFITGKYYILCNMLMMIMLMMMEMILYAL